MSDKKTMILDKVGISKTSAISFLVICGLAFSILFMFGTVIADTTFLLNITNQSSTGEVNWTQSTFTNHTNGSIINAFVQEDIAYVYNFSISHFSTDNLNLTGINITLPLDFIFTDGSNKTGNLSTSDASPFFNWTLSGTQYTLYWNSTTAAGFLINYTGHNNYTFFSFNVTAPDPGRYNMTIDFIYNNSKSVTAFNRTIIQITVNDTTVPKSDSLNLTILDASSQISNNTAGNYHKGIVSLNISIIENGIANVYFNLTNNSGQSNSSMFYRAFNSSISNDKYWNYSLNTALLPDGNYTLWVWVNDSNNNQNKTARLNFTIDNSVPTGTMSCSPIDAYVGTVISCTCTSSDVSSGVSSTVYSSAPSSTNAGADLTQTCTVTDLAGNIGIITSNKYTIWGNPATGGSSGGSTSTTAFAYTQTISQTSVDLSSSGSIETSGFTGGGLGVKTKVTFKVNNEEHYIGIRALSTNSATIEIASDPIQINLGVGVETKQDLDGDGFYDVSVKLNSITNGKADLTITYLHEKASVDTTPETGEDTTAPLGEGETPTTTIVPFWIWIIIVLVIASIIVGVKMLLGKKRKK